MMTGSTSPVVFLPWQGEFGLMLIWWVRYVQGFQADHKIVCCRAGDEAYFPSAKEYIHFQYELVPDDCRRGAESDALDNPLIQELMRNVRIQYPEVEFRHPFCGRNHKWFKEIRPILAPLVQRGLFCDVVIGPRVRQYRRRRNWNHWPLLVSTLKEAGYSMGLIGKKSTSFNSSQVDLRAWENGDDGSANIEMLQSCKLYIGSDTGTSHLAALISTPSIIFRHGGRGSGIPVMQETTQGRFQFLENGWNDPSQVIEAALNELKSCRTDINSCQAC